MLQRPTLRLHRPIQAQPIAKIISDTVLYSQVLLELVVILNHFVPSSFKLMDERTSAFGLVSVAGGASEEVGTVLAGTKGALKGRAVIELEAVETLEGDGYA